MAGASSPPAIAGTAPGLFLPVCAVYILLAYASLKHSMLPTA